MLSAKNPHLVHLLEINLAMIFVSTSGALGRFIDLPVPITIASRALLAFLLLWLFCKWRGISLRIDKKDYVPIFMSGIFMGLHWITYFYALKLSNVAIGMLSLFTYPVITSLLEPILLKTKFLKIHLLLGLMVLGGIYFLVPKFELGNSYALAVGVGVLSALCYALRNLVLKARVKNYNGSSLMCYQMIIVSAVLLPVFFFMETEGVLGQWKGLLTLALLTTAIGHTLFLNTFKYFSITTASIISSVQPVYGIIIGAIFLAEIPSLMTIFGGILILGSVVIESVRTYR
ncbi:DMT family transporter [Sediminicola sp. 1XM1-17]|uniref:DMT family transporter n=1 Tax=Sediminicola sp. 1XM1-17 TaxID=3127702 RepID=UPI0030776C80